MVYVHKKKTNGKVFYVGIGKGRRPYVSSSRNQHWKNIVAKHGFDAEIVFCGLSEPCAKTIEKILIAKIGINNLCNITSGGEGTSGWTPSAKTKRKISASLRRAWECGKFDGSWCNHRKQRWSKIMSGENNPMYGKKLSRETREKISKALSGEKHPSYGKKLTEEQKGKISASLTGRKLSRDHKEAISIAQKGKKQSPETIAKRTEKTENKSVFEFVNNDGGHFRGTMRSFAATFGIDRSSVSKLTSGKSKSCKGWVVK